MKNNKRSPFTIARQRAFTEETGIQTGIPFKDALASELEALQGICKELIGVDTPDMELDRKRLVDGSVNHTESVILDDGTYARNDSGKEVDFGTGYRCHTPGQDCNAELAETDASLVQATGHGHADESIAAPINA
jgi:hypothetical protein